MPTPQLEIEIFQNLYYAHQSFLGLVTIQVLKNNLNDSVFVFAKGEPETIYHLGVTDTNHLH